MHYKLSKIAEITGGRLIGKDLTVGSVLTDSRWRRLTDRPLFASMEGRNHDGHAYVNEMYARGIRVFLIERDIDTEKYPDCGFVRVDTTLLALQQLAADFRDTFTGKVAAVTGSNGKTVVKEWILELCPPEVVMFRSPKSYNSQLGVPLSLLMARGDEDIILIEAGISEPGEMERLEKIIRPDIGIITNIGDAHQENFSSLDQKLGEKLSLFRNAEYVIYNGADETLSASVTHQLLDKKLIDFSDSKYSVGHADRFSSENTAVALAFWDLMGYPPEALKRKASELTLPMMRLEIKEGLHETLLFNDTYNADLDSLEIALDFLTANGGLRPKAVILSDILQSGYPPPELYSRASKMIRHAGISKFVGIGTQIRRYADLFAADSIFYDTPESFLREQAISSLRGHAVLVKGNHRSGFDKIIKGSELRKHTTVMEIDLDAIAANFSWYRSRIPSQTGIIAMLKARGYGHGDRELASALVGLGVSYLAVAFADEGVTLRKEGIKVPIVVLNADADSYDTMIDHGLEPEIYSFDSLRDFIDTLRRHGETGYPIHIKIDTGMHRLGFLPEEACELGESLISQPHAVAATVFSHLSSADMPENDPITFRQFELFDSAYSALSDKLGYKPRRHILNSAGVARFPEYSYEMVRIGIGLYGFGDYAEGALRPAAALTSKIVQIKRLEPGEAVGYAAEGRLDKGSLIATVPVGYADGLDRRLGNGNWAFEYEGKALPTVGRISMDSCAVDVTGTDARVGDVVTIFGARDGFTAADMAGRLGTISYEILTGISPRVKHIYIKE